MCVCVHSLASLCNLQSTKAVYNRIIDLRIATPQIVINFGLFLEENDYYEEAFKVCSLELKLLSVQCTDW